MHGIRYVLCLSVVQKAVLPPGTDVMSPCKVHTFRVRARHVSCRHANPEQPIDRAPASPTGMQLVRPRQQREKLGDERSTTLYVVRITLQNGRSTRQHWNTPGGNTAYAVPVVTPPAAPIEVYAVMTCEW